MVKYLMCIIGIWMLSCSTKPPQKGIMFNVDEQLTVWLPARPREMNAQKALNASNSPSKNDPMAHTAQVFRLEDHIAVYIIIRIPLLEAPQLPVAFAEREAHYVSRTIPLMMDQAHGELMSQTINNQNGVDVIILKYKTINAAGVSIIKYSYNVTVRNIVYQLYFIPKDQQGDSNQEEKTRFFNPTILAKR
ncbi:hypothetical protein LRS06_09430 [Hymenobacter sp. J193]|uniref:hypothetical protein n=1 Tax=Hymenobacter sp. J193 TaxID=2898429 RepID=UPI00215182CA|nr:hypothetical protein [Hymenobacter sp. J193]MCR5887997.1 hypothetical protein [Hymenobacter sp. J193]